ncbi:MAG: PAS domain-containing protein [Sphingomonadaceae bacterium]|nr:PAS domain-containing protein [Sphingomonadaceae bacterium]
MADKGGKAKKPARQNGRKRPVAVVGIGLCAASLNGLETLFAALDDELGVAYVIAIRQQDGVGVEQVIRSLSRGGRHPVKIAENGERLEPGHVYVGGPEDLITLVNDHIEVRKAQEPVGHRGTVDSMLMSLAEHEQERAIALILTGLGSEGTAGVTATKKYGGLSIAESINGEAEAAAHGAATPAGIVDLLLPIEQIPAQITLYVRGLETLGAADARAELPQQVSDQLVQIATVLRNVTGNDFHGYKTNTFLRRVQRRMQVVQIASIEAYAAQLKKDREEVHHLFQDLLIGVTQFFRDPQEFQVLERELPKLFKGKRAEDQFRVWVLGCATGEEAYSIAILLAERLAELDDPPHVQIFATDLDARALGAARAGRYASTIAEHVGPERLARWFVKEGDTYCVAKELREMCIFSPHNLIKDAPFSRIDLLSCRNLLIYLNTELQDRVIPIFHFSLRPGGILFLGSSENVTRHQKLFTPIDRKNRLFRRVETAVRVLPEFPLSARTGRREMLPDKLPPPVRPAGLSAGIGRRAAHLAERYAPAYVVVDRDYEVLHFSGRTGRYLEPATGTATLNLLNLVHRDLRLDLRAALHRAIEEARRVESALVPIRDNGDSVLVKLLIEPIAEAGDLTALMIVFQEAGPLPEASASAGVGGASDEHVERLEAELRLTKERLQATIEELESTNEELKSSNEEYQSINEELQSANEELETSKEELQSVNEELQTVNAELAHRVSDLARANSDLKNLLESTQIATVFLDNELRVRSFTPAATEVFHLLETDVGRPIEHLGSRVSYPELSDDVRKVLTRLGTVEREVTSREGGHYIARVHPYRSVDNFIAGAVLTFLDVTSTVRAESALRESEARLRVLLAELQHRVRNTLAVVKSIANRTAHSSSSIEDMVSHLNGRLDAFARVQAAVTRTPDVDLDLAQLIQTELQAHAVGAGEQLTVEGPPVALPHKAAESLNLAVHELTTNAAKHGALNEASGRVAIAWSVDGPDGARRLNFSWQETIDGRTIPAPSREGFGIELLTRILPYELDAKTSVETRPDGLRFTLDMPIADEAARAAAAE